MSADKLTRWTAVAAVLAVAAVAALISYRHTVQVVTAHGESGLVGHLYPVVIDGLIIAASMVLLDSARHRDPAPKLAWWMLLAGIVATLAANVLAGVASGLLGSVVAAWPALAFVGCYELVMVLVRASAARMTGDSPADTERAEPDVVSVPVPSDAEHAALLALQATHAVGNPLSGRQLETRFGLTRAQATKLRKLVIPEAAKQADAQEAVAVA